MNVLIATAALGMVLGGAAIGCTGDHEHGKTVDTAPPGADAGAGTVLDPVCGMRIDPKTAAAKAEYQGKEYYFCDATEKTDFEKDPEKYLKKTD
jgi:P-type Cu+ transporter